MRISILIISVAAMALHCAPKPTQSVDLTKARASFQLANGGSVSDPTADDISPVLVAKPDGSVILVFASDRTPCGICTPGDFHIFIAESIGPIYRDEFGPVFPLFQDPVVVEYGGSSVVIDANTALSASYNAGKLEIYARVGGVISYVEVDAASLASGSAIGVTSSSNTNYDSDFLLTANHREFMPITSDGVNAYEAPFASAAVGNLLSNYRVASADAIAQVPSLFTGFLDSYFVADGGQLYVGTAADDYGEHEEFNEALDAEGLYLSGISVHRSMFHAADVVVFSAYEYETGQHDLFAVTSHDVSTLWALTFLYGGDFQFNPGPYRIYVTNASYTGAFGSVFGADAMCYFDSKSPDVSVIYKAMIVDSAQRVATTNGTDATGQVNWVFFPGESYIRATDGASLGVANGNGFLTLGSVPANGILGALGTTYTGMAANWTTNAGNTCTDWTTTAGNGAYGDANTNGAGVIYSFQATCGTLRSLYCVEQP